MIRDKEGIYRFTEEEKARVQRRSFEAQKIRDLVKRWYLGVTCFPIHIYRSKRQDENSKDTTIIKYNIFSESNGAILDLAKADLHQQDYILKMLRTRLEQQYPRDIFRIKFYIEKTKWGVVDRARLQVIFVEYKDCYTTVKGKPIEIVYELKDDTEDILPW